MEGEWKWLNNDTLISKSTNISDDSNTLNLTKYWNETSRNQLGKCGSIVVLEDNQVVLRSSPCSRTDERFICTYGKHLISTFQLEWHLFYCFSSSSSAQSVSEK